MIVEERALNYNEFINLGKVLITELEFKNKEDFEDYKKGLKRGMNDNTEVIIGGKKMKAGEVF